MRVGWCAKTVSSAAAPFAIASKLGWFEKDGIKVDLVPPARLHRLRQAGRHQGTASLAAIGRSHLAIIRPQGVKAKFFYTAYQANIYGIAVPADSAVKSVTDLKGKKIGVTSMASAGVIVARALVKASRHEPGS